MSISKTGRKQITIVCCCVVIAAGGYSAFVGIRNFISPKESLSHDDILQTPELKVDAKDLKHTIVVPHLEQAIDGDKNVLWCATFQLCWDKIIEDFAPRLRTLKEPVMVASLNKSLVSRNDHDPDSYVVHSGYMSAGFIKEVEKALDKKFHGCASPDLLYRIRREVGDGNWGAYSYLFKQLPFEHKFNRMREGLQFDGKSVKCFGIDQYSDGREWKLAKQIKVWNYGGADDLVVELVTTSNTDRLILAKVKPEGTLLDTIQSVKIKADTEKSESLEPSASLKVPILNFDVFRCYHELLETARLYAVQQTRFRLDETGAFLKSEAGGIGGAMLEPKHLIFDKPFLIMIQRAGADMPYFAFWVANAELLVPFE